MILRSGATSFEYERRVQPQPESGPWRGELERLLAANAARPSRERLTLMRLFEELRGFGYGGGYDAVRRYAASWRRRENAATTTAFVPLSFAPGEAYQFDWSHEIVVINGVTTIVKVAHLQPDAVRAGVSTRELGDGVRRPRPDVRLFQGHLHAGHLRQHEDGGGHRLRR